jgi:hypothetical protein
MSNYIDRFSLYHDKVVFDGKASSGNPAIYTAYAKKLNLPINYAKVSEAFYHTQVMRYGKQVFIRHPDKPNTSPFSRDEVLGWCYLGFLQPFHLNGWSFSPYPIPAFSLKKLIKQIKELKGQHRNYFWKNGLDQIYRFAFSVPLQDRAFLLECWGETKSLRYFFYKGIAMLDAKFAKPKNGIHWLKYGGEDRKKIMQEEFPGDHPLRSR